MDMIETEERDLYDRNVEQILYHRDESGDGNEGQAKITATIVYRMINPSTGEIPESSTIVVPNITEITKTTSGEWQICFWGGIMVLNQWYEIVEFSITRVL